MAGSLFSVLILAGIGGSIIFIGLLLEKFWEDKTFKNQSHLKRSKIIKEIGEWAVIVGVAVEIAVAIIFAKDAWENDPRDQPVRMIKAEARLVIFTDDTSQGFFSYPAQNWWLESVGGIGNQRGALYLLTGISEVTSVIQGTPSTNIMCIIEFKSLTADSWVFQYQAPQNQPHGPAKEVMRKTDELLLLPPFFNEKAHIVRGRIALTFNDSVTKYFDIGDTELDRSKAKFGLLATNSASSTMQ